MKPTLRRGPFRYQVASDITRDGVGLELLDGQGDIVAEVFRCDADKSVVVSTFSNDIPLGAMTELLEQARKRLDPFEDGTPLGGPRDAANQSRD